MFIYRFVVTVVKVSLSQWLYFCLYLFNAYPDTERSAGWCFLFYYTLRCYQDQNGRVLVCPEKQSLYQFCKTFVQINILFDTFIMAVWGNDQCVCKAKTRNNKIYLHFYCIICIRVKFIHNSILELC